MSAPKYSEQSFIQFRKVSILAGKKKPVNIYGKAFACTEATGKFQMSFNDGEFFDVKKGAEWSMAPDDYFNRLTFLADADTEIEFYAGSFFYHENVVVPVIKVAPTIIKGFAAAQIGPTSQVTFYGTGGPGGTQAGAAYHYRKSIVITNNDTASNLELFAIDGTTRIATVFFKQAWVLETSADLIVKNETGVAINCRVAEIFYPAVA